MDKQSELRVGYVDETLNSVTIWSSRHEYRPTFKTEELDWVLSTLDHMYPDDGSFSILYSTDEERCSICSSWTRSSTRISTTPRCDSQQQSPDNSICNSYRSSHSQTRALRCLTSSGN